MKEKLLSIIITCYNNEKYIKKCINSVVNYLSDEVELIIIDDSSLDNSNSIIKSIIKKNPTINYFSIKHSGISNSRNYGIKKSKGKFIMFIDGDDYLYKNSINNIIKYIKNNNFDLLLINTMKYFEKDNYYESEILSLSNINNIKQKDLILNKICARPWRFIYNKKIIIENKLTFHNNLIYEDEEWIPKVIYYSKKIKFLNNATYVYRKHNNSITSNKSIEKIKDLIKIVDSTYKWSQECYNNKYNYFSLSRCIKNILSYLIIASKKEQEILLDWYKNNYYKIMNILKGNRKLKILLIIFGPYNGIRIYKKYFKEKNKLKKIRIKINS